MDTLDFAVGVLYLADCCFELRSVLLGLPEVPRHAISGLTQSRDSLLSISEVMLLEEEPMPHHITKLMEMCRARLDAVAALVLESLGMAEREESDPQSDFCYDSDGYPVRASTRRRRRMKTPRGPPAGNLVDDIEQVDHGAQLLRSQVEQVYLWRLGDDKTREKAEFNPSRIVRNAVRDARLSQISKLRRALFVQLRLDGRNRLEASGLLDSLTSSVEHVWNGDPIANPDSVEGRNLKHVSQHYGAFCAGRMRVKGQPFVDTLINVNDTYDGAFISTGSAEYAGSEGPVAPGSDALVTIEWSKGRYSKLYATPFEIESGVRKCSSCCFPALSVGLQTLCANNDWVRADDELSYKMYAIVASQLHRHSSKSPKFSFAKLREASPSPPSQRRREARSRDLVDRELRERGVQGKEI